jgi:hypothetical protein
MPDLGPHLVPTTGLISSPVVGTTGITVADAAGVTRVQMGQIGTSFGQNYGLKVIGPDGQTVIIDGTSDIFKIAATGTAAMNLPATTPDNAVDTILAGLGTFTITPAAIFATSSDTTAQTSNKFSGQSRSAASPAYVANSSGGSPTTPTATSISAENASIRLTGAASGNVVVTLWGVNPSASALPNVGMRYWVLTQASL